MKTPHPVLSLFGISAQGCGILFLPFVVGLACSAFFDVSEVADTAGALTFVALVFILPPMALQVLGVIIKVGRERRMLREAGQLGASSTLASIHRHMRIVTPRGWGALFTGAFFVFLSLSAKWASLGLLAVLSLLLFYMVLGVSSFVSTFLVRSFQHGLGRSGGAITRELSPAVVVAGQPAEERFHLTKVPVPPGFLLLVEDRNVPQVQTESRYAVGAGARRTHVTVSGRFRHTPRGLHRFGPAQVYYQDVLGFTRVSVASLATAELKVLPRFRGLEILEPPRSRLEAPDVVCKPHRYATEDHFRFKEYHAGDDTRRIHWRLSIRTGTLQVRLPETKEQSTRQVILVLDSYLPRGRLLADAVGMGKVLDHLVETWISLAAELEERGDKVTLVAVVDDGAGQGHVAVERMEGSAGHRRWQDLGARVRWQGAYDLPQVLGELDDDLHAVAVSSRFYAPPAESMGGDSFTWIYLPPLDALGEDEPAFWKVWLGRPDASFFQLLPRMARLPGPAGSDENRFIQQLRDGWYTYQEYQARRRLRFIALRRGQATLTALTSREETVYKLEPGPRGHRLVGLVAGKSGAARRSGAA
ncbi:MAG: DUF58 domain-containing protein [Alphaproteobacteria bacterium]|nr:DUF58 domain-containing protein [Alphaproteobacteria bacterium]